jgi:hypothetical protein
MKSGVAWQRRSIYDYCPRTFGFKLGELSGGVPGFRHDVIWQRSQLGEFESWSSAREEVPNVP